MYLGYPTLLDTAWTRLDEATYRPAVAAAPKHIASKEPLVAVEQALCGVPEPKRVYVISRVECRRFEVGKLLLKVLALACSGAHACERVHCTTSELKAKFLLKEFITVDS